MDADEDHIETSLERHIRRHDEDKISNPNRHLLNKNMYSKEEVADLCVKCCHPQLMKDYEIDFACNVMRRKVHE